jgi:hypothetical protein
VKESPSNRKDCDPEGAVTESEWQNAADPLAMLEFLRADGKRSERKARLFAVACWRRIWPLLTDGRSQNTVETLERFADGLASAEELKAAWGEARSAIRASRWEGLTSSAPAEFWATACVVEQEGTVALRAARAAAGAMASPQDPDEWKAAWDQEQKTQAGLLRDLYGSSPFRPLPIPGSVKGWNSGLVVRLAQAAYDHRQLPAGTLEPERLAVLADALEEAGCPDAELLPRAEGWAERRAEGGTHPAHG